MSLQISIARPYAKAIFERALASKHLQEWSDFLACLDIVVNNSQIIKLVRNPFTDRQQQFEILNDLCTEQVFPEAANLLRLLICNRRLECTDEICQLYEHLRSEAESRLDVEVTSAQPLTEQVQNNLKRALENRLKRKIILSFGIDETLLGGALIRTGDLVIDGSVRGKLKKMTTSLTDES